MDRNDKEFLLALANLMEAHDIRLASRVLDNAHGDKFSYVTFLKGRDKEHLFPNMVRCHLTPYDLRTQAGMSCGDANMMYKILKDARDLR